VGPSGAGKTTFCHLIPRFYEPEGGRVLIDGVDVSTVSLQSLRAAIGIVQQDVFLFTGTIRDNIAYGKPGAGVEQIQRAAGQAGAHSFILELPAGYDTHIGEKGIKLSGGQKQRISIARAFLKNPNILVLDEATSSLDTQTEMIIREALDKLIEGRTTLIIAHRLSTIRNADEIIVLAETGIVQRGTHDELVGQPGLYAELYNAQTGLVPDRE
jgi:ATP-binding cassette subfamily B protein